MSDHEVLALARKLRMDLTAMQTKVSELMAMAGKLEPPADGSGVCPECGLRVGALPQGTSLGDHRWVSHGVDSPVYAGKEQSE